MGLNQDMDYLASVLNYNNHVKGSAAVPGSSVACNEDCQCRVRFSAKANFLSNVWQNQWVMSLSPTTIELTPYIEEQPVAWKERCQEKVKINMKK